MGRPRLADRDDRVVVGLVIWLAFTLPFDFWGLHSIGPCLFRSSSNLSCPYGYDYDTSTVGTTIISEWDLVCDHQYVINLIQMIIMFGSLLGSAIFGIAADKYGRRTCLLISCFIRFVFGVLSGAATNVTNFAVLRFLLALFDGGIHSMAMIMCLEVLSGRYRLILSIIFQMSFYLGFPLMAYVTYLTKNWRYTQIILYTSSFLTFFCTWMSPESPRWLLTLGKKESAINVLEKAARKNKREFHAVKKLVHASTNEEKHVIEGSCFWLKLFNTPKLRNRTILSCVNGLVLFLITYGVLQYFGEFSSNPFFDLFLQGLTGMIGCAIAAGAVVKYNRRTTIALTFVIIALCSCVKIGFPTNRCIDIACSAIIYCCVGVETALIEPFVGELFPTVLRNSGYGVFMMCANLGAIIAPIFVSLVNDYASLPLISFCILSLIEVFFVLLLPDIQNKKLPDTIEDVEE
ncbi:hypothetical protein FQA39_LY17123 [Lamprigera yunnana]|nr:hypothetical protein FQA39_LY17123 [Lamprigera yunnana]